MKITPVTVRITVLALVAWVSAFATACRTDIASDRLSAGASFQEARVGVPSANMTDRCVADFDSATDYFPDKVVVERAGNFSVSYHGNYKVLRTRLIAEEWAGSMNDVAVLVQCGTPVPPLEGDLAGAQVVEIPVASVAANFLDDVARIREIGHADRLVAIGDGRVYDAQIRARWERGELLTLGHAFHAGGDTEQLLLAAPDVFLANIAGPAPLENVRRLGVTAVATAGWAEAGYMARAEWVKHAALFFNAEAEANRVWRALVERVDHLTQLTSGLPEQPTVMWTWHDGADRWSAFRSSYEHRLITDAGAYNLFGDDELRGMDASRQSVELSEETMLTRAASVDVWITSGADDRSWPSAAFLNSFRAYRDGRVYHRNGRVIPGTNANDWNETGSVRPDLILEDLIHLLHPSVLPDHQLLFFGTVELTKRNETL